MRSGPCRPAAVELVVDVLAFDEAALGRQKFEFGREVLAVQEGRADLDDAHAEFARQHAGERHFELRIGEQEQAATAEFRAIPVEGAAGARLGQSRDGPEQLVRDPEGAGCRGEPRRGALGTEREQGRKPLHAPLFEASGGLGQERLREQHPGGGPDRRQVRGTARR